MHARKTLDRLFTLLLLFVLPLTAAVAMAAPDGDDEPEVKREVVIKLKIDGEDYQITNLEELEKHAAKLKDHIDIEKLTKMFQGEDGHRQIRILRKGGGGGDVKLDVMKKIFISKDGETVTELKGDGGVWVAKDGDDRIGNIIKKVIVGGDGKGLAELKGAGNVWISKDHNEELGNFMIGLACKVADDTLRAHLDIEDGALVVIESLPETPAHEAGFTAHDILLKADGQELSDLVSLIKAVEVAGDEDRNMKIRILRSGKEKTVSVKPQKRPAHAQWRFEVNADVESDEDGEHDGVHEEHEVIILHDSENGHGHDGTSADDLREMIEELRAELRKMKKSLKDKE